jgi:hypothetical protein
LLALVVASSCSRGGSGGDAGVARRRVSTDVRTVLFQTIPEYRGVHVERGAAMLTRRYGAPLTDEVLDRARRSLGWAPRDGGFQTLGGYLVAQVGPETLSASLPLDDELIGRVYTAPQGPSSLDFGLYLPKQPAIVRDVFTVELETSASSVERQGFVAHQLVELLVASGQWVLASSSEGLVFDAGPVPDRFTAVLKDTGLGAEVRVTRDQAQARIVYRLVTDEQVSR